MKQVRKRLPSPNFSGRDGADVSILLLHYTGMKSAEGALERLCLAEAKVSAHYVVDEDGTGYALVDEENCAWHAGVSFWRGHKNVNNISVGVEIVNPGHEWGYRAFPKVQMQAVAELCQDVLTRHAIPARNVIAHSDVAPQRKIDPGELFDWKWLAGEGVGVWPTQAAMPSANATLLAPKSSGEAVLKLQQNLAAYGYEVPQSGHFDELTRHVVAAFQRHFRPRDVAGLWDEECEAVLAALAGVL